jgi:hypothetical protein
MHCRSYSQVTVGGGAGFRAMDGGGRRKCVWRGPVARTVGTDSGVDGGFSRRTDGGVGGQGIDSKAGLRRKPGQRGRSLWGAVLGQ